MIFAQMHDIVRDFTLAAQAGSSLHLLQRSFITTLVSGVSSNPASNTTETSVSVFACSNLDHHLRGTLLAPLANDDLAIILLLHEVPSIATQALASVKRSDVDNLIDHFLTSNLY